MIVKTPKVEFKVVRHRVDLPLKVSTNQSSQHLFFFFFGEKFHDSLGLNCMSCGTFEEEKLDGVEKSSK